MGKDKIRPLLGYSSTCVPLWLQSLGRAGRDKKKEEKAKEKALADRLDKRGQNKSQKTTVQKFPSKETSDHGHTAVLELV